MLNSDTYIFGYLLPVVNNKPIKKTGIFKKYPVYFVSKCQTKEPTAPANAVNVLRANHLLLSSIFAMRSSASACRVPSGGWPFPSCSLQIGSKRAVRRSSNSFISVMSSCISKVAGGRVETHAAGYPSKVRVILWRCRILLT